jgi:septal ring factor EnvC (AmiA/AmiB activator)
MTDSEILDRAIANNESLHQHLWAFRAMVKKPGDIKTQYDQTKESLVETEKYRDELNAQLEATKAELAKAQKDRVETDKANAALNSQISEKRNELQGLSNSIEQFKAILRAA